MIIPLFRKIGRARLHAVSSRSKDRRDMLCPYIRFEGGRELNIGDLTDRILDSNTSFSKDI